MRKTGMEFKIRNWVDLGVNLGQPFDVVALDHDNNTQHYQPGVKFSTEQQAEKHAKVLTELLQTEPDSADFIRNHWPIDGGIE